jgi:hypothetical protein
MTLAAIVDYQYNTNVFDVQSGYSVPGLTSSTKLGDSILTYTGAYDIRYQWQQQLFFADLSGSEIRYDYFSELDHPEYSLDAGWSGKFGDFLDGFDGNAEVLRHHTMIPFLDFVPGAVSGSVSPLSVSTEEREQGGLGLQVQTRWRIEGSAYTRDVTWPLPGEPNLKLNESEGQLAVKYLGTAALTSGVSVAYISGNYSGASDPSLNPPYEQKTAALGAVYAGGRSNFTGQIGYSSRTSSGIDSAINDVSGVTGSLNYTNQLTGKTSVIWTAARLINSYITESGSEIDTTTGLTLRWQATYKIGANLGYSYIYSQFPDQGTNGSTRLDHVQLATLRIGYDVLRWLSIKPYASYQLRQSNLAGANFNASVVGVDLTAQWQK